MERSGKTKWQALCPGTPAATKPGSCSYSRELLPGPSFHPNLQASPHPGRASYLSPGEVLLRPLYGMNLNGCTQVQETVLFCRTQPKFHSLPHSSGLIEMPLGPNHGRLKPGAQAPPSRRCSANSAGLGVPAEPTHLAVGLLSPRLRSEARLARIGPWSSLHPQPLLSSRGPAGTNVVSPEAVLR